MDELKALIDRLNKELAALRAGDRTAEAAEQIIAKREELATAQASLATIEAAFAEDEVEETPAEETPAEETPADETPAEVPAEAPAAPEAVVDAPAAEAPVALAASATDVSPTAEDEADEAPAMSLTASANMGGVHSGAKLDRDGVLKMLQSTLTAAGGPTNGPSRIFEIDRWGSDLTADMIPGDDKSAIANTRIIREARTRNQQPTALTAANCFCGPTELIRETGVVGDRGRPIAGIFPTIPLSGAFRAMPDLSFDPVVANQTGSVAQWTCDDQALVDPDDPLTWKQCSTLDCFTEAEYIPYMVVACTTVRRQHRWAHPEQVDAWLTLLSIEYDSLAETLLLDKIEAEAGPVLTVGTAELADHGVLAQLLYALGNLSVSLGYQFRSDALAGHTVIVPKGMLDALIADELIRGFPSGIKTKGEVRSLVEQAYGVTLVERMDEATSQKAAYAATVTALNAGGAIDGVTTPLLPPAFRLYVLRTDQWVHGEGVLVGADWHVDNEQLRMNTMQYFLENVEILELLGVEPPKIVDIQAAVKGSYTDLAGIPATP